MTNCAAQFNDEIARLARKEIRAELEAVKKTAVRQKQQISSLKDQLSAVERQAKQLARGSSSAGGSVAAKSEESRRKGIRLASRKQCANCPLCDAVPCFQATGLAR